MSLLQKATYVLSIAIIAVHPLVLMLDWREQKLVMFLIILRESRKWTAPELNMIKKKKKKLSVLFTYVLTRSKVREDRCSYKLSTYLGS